MKYARRPFVIFLDQKLFICAELKKLITFTSGPQMSPERVWVPPGSRSLQILPRESNPLWGQLEPGERQVAEPREEAALEHSSGRAEEALRLRGLVLDVEQVLYGERRVLCGLASLLRVRVCHRRFTVRCGSPSTKLIEQGEKKNKHLTQSSSW